MASRQLGYTAIVLATAIAGPACAQQSDSDGVTLGAGDPAVTMGKSETVSLETVSVTATRNPIDSFEYPGMVTIVDRERIQQRQPSTLDDVLKWVPNVEFTGGPRRNGEVPSIRGFSGADVIVTLDGARQNFNSGHDGRFYVDPMLLREVEVLRGPASSLYGSGGLGGVIAMRTVRPDDFLAPGETAGVTVGGGYQSVNNEYRETVTGYAKPTDDVGVLASVSKLDSGSIELGDGSKLTRSDNDIVSGLVKGDWTFADHHRLEASFQRFQNDAQEPNNGQGAGDDNLVDKDITSDTWRLNYAYADPANDLVDLDAIVYYTDTTLEELRLDNNGNGPAGELLEREVATTGFRVDNRSRIRLSNDVGVTFTYGTEGYQDRQDSAADGAPRSSVPEAETTLLGGYAQAEVRIAEPFGVLPGDLLAIPGVRYDRYSSTSDVAADNEDHAVSPRFGLSYLPTDWSLLFANYGTAFRAPTIDELYTSGVHFQMPIGSGVTNRFISNPDLDPQRTQTIEFGGGLDFDDVVQSNDRLRVKATHFRTQGEDFIDLQVNQPAPFTDCNPFVPGACDGTTQAVNIADAELWGNEIEATYENRRIRLQLGFSTIDGENEATGEPLGILTPPQLTTDAAVKLPEIDSIVGWRMLAADEFDEVSDPAETRPGYAVHDLYFAWAPSEGVLDGLRVDLGVDNIFDKAYARAYTNAFEPGRNFKGFVRYALTF
ncbi:TonB-dependent hemoglobin/transferrin/lactoferrin family receptor [Rhodovibrio salinarum]|nr:TonB-dependent hemoglobin/transferrin/lactoferrin family receptor [Rhodovibrio salinarum]